MVSSWVKLGSPITQPNTINLAAIKYFVNVFNIFYHLSLDYPTLVDLIPSAELP